MSDVGRTKLAPLACGALITSLAALATASCKSQVTATTDLAAPASAHLDASIASAIDAALATTPSDDAAAPIDAGARVFSSWTDPEGIALLTSDCHAQTASAPEGERDPFVCRLPFEQSCTYDPCAASVSTCRESCEKTCGSCDDACVSTCDSCEAKCKDDACKAACATKTASCKQACIKTVDHCSSAKCSPLYDACESRAVGAWKSHHCSCRPFNECVGACNDDCTNACKRADASKRDDCESVGCNAHCESKCGATMRGCDLKYCTITGVGPD